MHDSWDARIYRSAVIGEINRIPALPYQRSVIMHRERGDHRRVAPVLALCLCMTLGCRVYATLQMHYSEVKRMQKSAMIPKKLHHQLALLPFQQRLRNVGSSDINMLGAAQARTPGGLLLSHCTSRSRKLSLQCSHLHGGRIQSPALYPA